MNLEKITKITQNKKEYDKWVEDKKYRKICKRFHKDVKADVVRQARKGINFSMTDIRWEDSQYLTWSERKELVDQEVAYWKSKGFEAEIHKVDIVYYITMKWEIEDGKIG